MKAHILTTAFGVLALSGLASTEILAQTPCLNGRAGIYPCNQVELLAHVSPQQLLAEVHLLSYINDIWGWTDPQTGKEYALVGMVNGTSFVDVTDPVNPVVIGILPEHHAAEGQRKDAGSPTEVYHDGAKSLWRDIKVYNDHAYIVSEDLEHGMQVFDLRQLRDATNLPVIFPETANYTGISNAHNIAINEATGFAYAVGTDGDGLCQGGGLHMIDLREPANPTFAGCYDNDGYTHDVQVVVYQGPDASHAGKEIAFAANEDAVTLVDVTDKTNPVLISTASYPGAAYVHQGWLTEDQQYFISNDELDEINTKTKTRTYIWDMRDLDAPQLLGTYIATTNSIDHNLYIKDGLVYQSNYTAGLRILSTENIEHGELEEVAFFDTHPKTDAASFHGTWSNYPFFKSGTIIVSDIDNGLFILKYKNPNATGLEEELAEGITIYPNPSQGALTVKATDTSGIVNTIGLYSLSGQKIVEYSSKDLGSGQKDYKLQLEGYTKGLYLLRITTNKKVISRKLVLK